MSNFTTTQTGTPVASDAHSLATGADGAIALHDRYLVEKLAQFNRERIPERIVHAKGGGAFGEFTVTEDVSMYTSRGHCAGQDADPSNPDHDQTLCQGCHDRYAQD